jgi:hypothetical protein
MSPASYQTAPPCSAILTAGNAGRISESSANPVGPEPKNVDRYGQNRAWNVAECRQKGLGAALGLRQQSP